MKTRNKILLLSLALIFLFFLSRPLWELPWKVKSATTMFGIDGYNTIVCEYAAVTGYDWYMISDETGVGGKYCNITGTTPWEILSYDCMIAGNHFVFYFDSRTEEYSEDLGETVVTYHAYDWDVLYPVKHNGPIDLLPMSWHILESDLRTSGEP